MNAEQLLKNFRVVLVEPLYGGNIGSTCRAMMNAGMTDLAIVSPRPDTDWDDARRLAYRATDVLDNIKKFDTLREALADCSMAAGTSARKGFYRNQSFVPHDFAPVALESARENKIALVFGREDKGLTNEELGLCTHIIEIPSSEIYRSLNLSHAVMVVVYEIFCAAGSFEAAEEGSPEASIEMRERMFDLYSEMMLRTGFVKPDKLDHMMMGLRRILSRGQLTDCDVRIMLGLARQALWVTERWEACGSPKK